MSFFKKIFYDDFIEEIKIIEFITYCLLIIEIFNIFVLFVLFYKLEYLVMFIIFVDIIDYFFFVIILLFLYYCFYILWIYLFWCFIIIICVCINSWIEGGFHVDEPIFKNFYVFFYKYFLRKTYETKKNEEFIYFYKRLWNLWLYFWRTHMYKHDNYVPLNEWDGIFYRCLYRFLKKHIKIIKKKYFDKSD